MRSLRTMASEKIKVFVVDDHPMIRVGLAAMIDAETDFVCVGAAANGAEAVRLVPAALPHVVLMDLVMPQMDGTEAIKVLREQLPSTKFVVLTSLIDSATIQRVLAAGASGYLVKTASSQEMVSMLRSVVNGQRVMSAEATDALIAAAQSHPAGADLTLRERELLALMTRGLNNQEIAAELAIAMATVKFHITNILGKLHVDNRTEAVIKALKHKLVPPV
jgi:NarL family two-component system response regulator LiaR